MPNKVREHPILSAVIGASGAIIAGFLGYEGATGGFGNSAIDYTGLVRSSLSKMPIDGAQVSIAEDQSIPQHQRTDSSGVFHAKLRKTSGNVRLDVEADGYRPYTIYVQPSRTGLEEVLLSPIASKSMVPPVTAPPSVNRATSHGNNSPAISGSTVGDININSDPKSTKPERR